MSRVPFIPPSLPVYRNVPPQGDAWSHEVKFDGFRVQLHKDGRDVRVYLRSGVDFTERFVSLAAAMLAAPAKSFVIDGEPVVSGPGDCPDFHALFRRDYHPDQLEVWCFDVLHLNGRDLRDRTLKERRARL